MINFSVDWLPILLSFKLALLTTILLLVLGLPLCYFMAHSRHIGVRILEVLCLLPLVFPPTVLGFYLLMIFSPNFAFGHFLKSHFNFQLAFSFGGLLFASVLYNLPFVVQPLLAGFRSLPKNLQAASFLMGKGHAETLFRVMLPNMKRTLWAAIVLIFVHTLGEFGVVLMIGGNISGETKVVSIAIYEAVEMMDYHTANTYALIMIAFALTALLTLRGISIFRYKS
ncbi:molybdate ABC transporter permease subunit [Persicobacter psychrovividus]|uniref:Molybdenum transport system permease n=1 Tax=Persicobacter psychrovividus TaxID=387638 RepID=A0ABN6LBB8_9BACT|nr:molybdenum ABC transporter permease subunit [Persicobacter psychrovividus]